MEFRLRINTSSVAFSESPEMEIASQLRGVANTLDYLSTLEHKPKIITPICDVNGTQCGLWSLSPATNTGVDWHNQVDALLSRVERAEELARRARAEGNEELAKAWDDEVEKERTANDV